MEELFGKLARLLHDVILPNLQAVRASQTEQIAASKRVEQDIEELRVHLDAQFSTLAAQLTACRIELAATQALLKATQQASDISGKTKASTLIH
jgi:hypothetical protein